MLLQGFRVLGPGTYGVAPSRDDELLDVRIEGARVLEVGRDLDRRDGEAVVVGHGRALIPGLRDGHTHLAWVARAEGSLDLDDCPSAQAVADAVAQWAREHPDGMVFGSGFHDGRFPDQPDKSLLDRAAPGRVVVLGSHDGHSAWASSAALAAAGADHPTGVLREDEMALTRHLLLAADDPTHLDEQVARVLARAAGRGLTEVLDIEFEDGWANWQRRARRGEAAPGVRVWVATTPNDLDDAIDDGRATGTGDGLVRAGYLKLFADGALGSRTALCSHEYPDRPGWHGKQMLTVEEMADFIGRARAGGIATAIHAIGDLANRNALDAFERSGASNGLEHLLAGRIEHAQQLAVDDVSRFRELGLIASVQPSHLFDDRDIADTHWRGATDRAYTFADLHRAGAVMEFGSDAPVAPLDPWRSIAAAVHRTNDDQPPWHPEQRVSLDIALTCSTDAATIEPGAAADLVILGAHPATVPGADLDGIPVDATLVAGHMTHDAGLEAQDR